MATKTEDNPREKIVDPRQKERRRAANYLDLWERHVTLMAINGKCLFEPDADQSD